MWMIFDGLIFFFLISVGIFLVHVWFHARAQKKYVLWLSIVLAIGWVTVFYGSFIESHRLVVNTQQITLSSSPTQSLRAAVFADLHVGPYKKTAWARRVVEKVMSQNPDIIFLLGDFVSISAKDVRYLEPLKNLLAPYGVYAVTGNHEYHARASEETVAALKTFGIHVLENESVRLPVNDQSLTLAGVSDIWFEGDLTKTIKGITQEEKTVLIAHNPDVMLDPASHVADVVVAGHTHGGEIRLPWIGSIAALPTKLGRAYDKGWFQFDQTKIFITSGVGEIGTRARLFNPPEIVVMEISL